MTLGIWRLVLNLGHSRSSWRSSKLGHGCPMNDDMNDTGRKIDPCGTPSLLFVALNFYVFIYLCIRTSLSFCYTFTQPPASSRASRRSACTSAWRQGAAVPQRNCYGVGPSRTRECRTCWKSCRTWVTTGPCSSFRTSVMQSKVP